MEFKSIEGRVYRTIKELPIISWFYIRVYSEIKVGRRFAIFDSENTFKEINKSGHWTADQQESVSGPGSVLETTSNLIEKLPELFENHQIKKLLDCPCGDFNWMRKVNLNEVEYIGGDIVDELVQRNNDYYSCDGKSFQVLDIINDTLPQSDLILVKDCFVHFSYNDIRKALQNISSSGIKYILVTHFPRTKRNFDITTGSWRPINFNLSPFLWPEAIQLIYEDGVEAKGQYPDKCLALYSLSDFETIMC